MNCSLAIHNAVLRACLEDVSTLKDLLKSATKCLKMLQWLQKRQKKVLFVELSGTKLVVLEVCSSCQKLRRQICRPGPGALLQAAPGCMCLQHRGSLSARAAHCSHCRLQSRGTTPALLPLLCSNHDHKLNSCSCSLYVGAYCI